MGLLLLSSKITSLLVTSNSQHSHIANSVGLIQKHTLILSNGTHSHLANSVGLIQKHTLVVFNGTHSHLTNTVTLLENFSLILSNGTHSHIAFNASLDTTVCLIPANGFYSQYTSTVVLSQKHGLVISDGTHSHSSIELKFNAIYLDVCYHITESSQINLAENYYLLSLNSFHVHSSENLILSLAVKTNSCFHSCWSEKVDLVHKHFLSCFNTSHIQVGSNISLGQKHSLSVAHARHSSFVERVGFLQFLSVSASFHQNTSNLIEPLTTKIWMLYPSSYVECAVCGFEFRKSQLTKRFDGHLVCKRDYDRM